MSTKRIVYIQYARPAAYPPLERSARQFADAGWDVLLLGTETAHATALSFAPHPRIRTRLLTGGGPGPSLKLRYLAFCAWATWTTLRWWPRWVYASDIMPAPVALVLKIVFRRHVALHEHDAYDVARPSLLMRVVQMAFSCLARVSDINVLPSEGRLAHFRRQTGAPALRCVCVFNCPACAEIRPAKPAEPISVLRLLYHGAINPERLPLSIVHALAALPDRVVLRVVGYEHSGSAGHMARLRHEAERLGVEARLEFVGAISHKDLPAMAADCDIGLACIPTTSSDLNMRTMAGASNKAFEYLAWGLPLIVDDLPDWRTMFVDPGYARGCIVEEADSLATALRWYIEDPVRLRAVGERGRQRILADWNYEMQFAPVLRAIAP